MYDNYDEEVNQYIDEHDIDINSNKRNFDYEIQNEYVDYEKFNLPLTMESKNSDLNKLNNEYNTFEFSLYQDLEDKWLEIEKKKKSLGELLLLNRTGMRIISIRRGDSWIYGPDKNTVILAGDVLIAKGSETGTEIIEKLADGEMQLEDLGNIEEFIDDD